ncbi:DUF6431 domain-containing protein [Brevibacillus borstelensis]|uniref:DUF6431 domain-containing protein n=1 Tax=Brevibacillus borstelensis TaxID=45462 RepID=UPI003CE4E7B0
MSLLRSCPAFFVRCAEVVPSPCCGEEMNVIGSRRRKVASESGEVRLLVIRRLRCSQCQKIHHELPDCVFFAVHYCFFGGSCYILILLTNVYFVCLSIIIRDTCISWQLNVLVFLWFVFSNMIYTKVFIQMRVSCQGVRLFTI